MRPVLLYDPEGLDGGGDYPARRPGLLRYWITKAQAPRLRNRLAQDLVGRLQKRFPQYKVTTAKGARPWTPEMGLARMVRDEGVFPRMADAIIMVTGPEWEFKAGVVNKFSNEARKVEINYVTCDMSCGLDLMDANAPPILEAASYNYARVVDRITQHAAAWPFLSAMAGSLAELGYAPAEIKDSMFDIPVPTQSWPGGKGNVRLRYHTRDHGDGALSALVTGLTDKEEAFWTQLANLSPKEAVTRLAEIVRQSPKKIAPVEEIVPMATELDLV